MLSCGGPTVASVHLACPATSCPAPKAESATSSASLSSASASTSATVASVLLSAFKLSEMAFADVPLSARQVSVTALSTDTRMLLSLRVPDDVSRAMLENTLSTSMLNTGPKLNAISPRVRDTAGVSAGSLNDASTLEVTSRFFTTNTVEEPTTTPRPKTSPLLAVTLGSTLSPTCSSPNAQFSTMECLAAAWSLLGSLDGHKDPSKEGTPLIRPTATSTQLLRSWTSKNQTPPSASAAKGRLASAPNGFAMMPSVITASPASDSKTPAPDLDIRNGAPTFREPSGWRFTHWMPLMTSNAAPASRFVLSNASAQSLAGRPLATANNCASANTSRSGTEVTGRGATSAIKPGCKYSCVLATAGASAFDSSGVDGTLSRAFRASECKASRASRCCAKPVHDFSLGTAVASDAAEGNTPKCTPLVSVNNHCWA